MSEFEPKQLGDFLEACRALAPRAFADEYAEAFFLHHGSLGDLQRPVGVGRTQVMEFPSDSGRHNSVKSDFLVFPLEQTGRSPFPNFISIGRTKNNDIVIDDASLSKFHAYVKTEGCDFLLQDAGSSNGTRIDDALVPPKEQGDPVRLYAGARVTFGRVDLTFLPAKEFAGLVLRSFKK